MSDQALTVADVHALQRDPTAEGRIGVLSKIVSQMEGQALAENEQQLAYSILEKLAGDVEEAVRSALAWQICNSPMLSPDLAKRLARDVASVAQPVLQHADCLDDSFLVEVIKEGDEDKQIAIALRPEISEDVSDALVDTESAQVVLNLMRNEGARFSDETLDRAWDSHSGSSEIVEAMAAREGLPGELVERMVFKVSECIRKNLVARYRVSPVVLRSLVENARESVTMQLIKPLVAEGANLESLVAHMLLSNRLTPSVLFRGLCSGDLNFFLHALSARGRVSLANVRRLAIKGGDKGLRALLERSDVTGSITLPFETAMEVVRETGYQEGSAESRAQFQIAVLARLYREFNGDEDERIQELLLQAFDGKSDELIGQALEMSEDVPALERLAS